MNITLPSSGAVVTTNMTEENVTRHVKKSFIHFTKGTDPDYSFMDKLKYIDLLRYEINSVSDYETAYKKEAGETVWNSYIEDVTAMVEFNDEFQERIFEAAKAPLLVSQKGGSHSEYYRYLNLISLIVKTVISVTSLEIRQVNEKESK